MKKTNKKAETTTTVNAVAAPVEVKELDFEFLRHHQTKPADAQFISDYKKELAASLNGIAELEADKKYGYAFSIVIDKKALAKVWGKSDVFRVTMCDRVKDGIANNNLIKLSERTCYKKDRDTNEEFELENEFIITKEEVKVLIDLLAAYAKSKSEAKKPKAEKPEAKKAESKPESKPEAKSKKATAPKTEAAAK